MKPATGGLLKALGVAFGVAVIVGNTIGVGILRTPGTIAALLPDAKWFIAVWLVGGLYALLGSLAYAELGAMTPRSGGAYVFTLRALGGYPAFIVGWTDWIASSGTLAAAAMTIGVFVGELWPQLADRAGLVAAVVVLIYVGLQAIGVRTADWSQQVLSLVKTLVLIALIAVCFLAPGSPAGTASGTTTVITAGAVVLALQGVIYTYDGWNGMGYFAGEVRDPGRAIPRAMAGGVLVVLAVYLALNIAFLYVLPLERMANQNLVAATAASVVLGPAGERVVRVIMIISLLAQANALLMISSRVPYAMAEDRLAPRFLRSVNQRGAPVPALVASAAFAFLLLTTRTFNAVLAVLAFYFVIGYLASFVALLVLRRREPAAPRPYRMPGFPWLPTLLVLGASAFLVGSLISDTGNALYALGLLIVSSPVYFVVRRVRAATTTDTATALH